MVSNECGQKLRGSRVENKNCLSYGQTVEHETLRLSVCNWEGCLEEMEKALFCAGASVTIYFCNVQLQGEKV